MMSLVDYASSSDEDEQIPKENPEKRQRFGVPATSPSSSAPPKGEPVHAHNRTLGPSTKKTETMSTQSIDLKLPDASFLLNSPAMPSNVLNASDHTSRVAAAMAESAARKRELKGSPATYPRTKVPKGNLPHSKRVPETVDGRLIPPQLAGRSNVVTEDISKLFVKKQSDSPTQ